MNMHDYHLPEWSNVEEQPMVNWISAVMRFKNRPNWMKTLYPKRETNSNMFEERMSAMIPDRFLLGKRGNIVEECCRRGCTYEYLLKNYCA